MLSAVVFASLAALGAAEVQPWTAPGPTDSRGPCPMLNTLANHGYLYVFPFGARLIQLSN